MKTYIGTKIIKAEPCKAWKDMGEHKAGDEGYKVVYKDGYESWSPKDVFEDAYRELVGDGLIFGVAIEAMKAGKRVAREGWNGKGMFLYYISADRYPAKTEIAKTIADDDGKVPYGAYVALKTVSGLVIPWTPNMLDMLAEDWVIVD